MRDGARSGHDFNSRPRMRTNLMAGSDVRDLQFQLPPSHEDEPAKAIMPDMDGTFQLPPSHEDEPRRYRSASVCLISTPALA